MLKKSARLTVYAVFLLLLSGPYWAAAADQAGTASAASGGTEPSLEETEQFITDKVKGEGHIHSEMVTRYNLPDGRYTTTTHQNDRESLIDFHDCGFYLPYSSPPTSKIMINLADISNVDIKNLQDENILSDRKDAVENHAVGDVSIVIPQTPPIYVVYISIKPEAADKSGGTSEKFYFREHDTAVRVSKAFAHAIVLCGGGKKELF